MRTERDQTRGRKAFCWGELGEEAGGYGLFMPNYYFRSLKERNIWQFHSSFNLICPGVDTIKIKNIGVKKAS
jgi:hypothetical protein